MKRIISLLLALTAVMCLNLPAFSVDATITQAAKEQNESARQADDILQDQSQPRLMVTGYKLEGGTLSPSKNAVIEITFKNFSKTKSIYNIKLTLSDESGEIQTQGMPSKYVEKIEADKAYVWKITLKAAKTAQTGEHKLTVNAEFEDKYYTPYASSDVIGIDVRQSVNLDFDGVMLPAKVSQGETATVTANLMNTGKTDLRNCKIAFDIEGLESGGVLFIGEIPAGESKDGSANLRASDDVLGEVKGKAAVIYEDAYGEEHRKEVEISSLIEKKEEYKEEKSQEKTKSNSLWWLFLLIGAAAGAGAGFSITTAVKNYKQRKDDELRL